jgi:TonB family protein
VAGGGEYGPSKLSGTIALSLGVACLALCVNWAHGQEPVRGFAIASPSSQDGPGVTVDIAGAALIHRTSVEYPRALIAKHVEGTVSVEATLDGTGNVIDAHVLSGPEELRKTALTAVLNWHFVPGSGSTRVIRMSFQAPAAIPGIESERKQGDTVTVRVPETSAVLTAQGQIELRKAEADEAQVRERQTALTGQFLEEEMVKARQELSRMENQPGAAAEDLAKLRAQVAELEAKLAAAHAANGEAQERVRVFRTEPDNSERAREREQELARAANQPGSAGEERERRLREALDRLKVEQALRPAREREGWQRVPSLAGRKLVSIEVRGLSDQSGSDLLSRLPLHEGDTLTTESVEAVGRAIRQFDEHLEFGYGREPEGIVLRIHPPGAAGAPLHERK